MSTIIPQEKNTYFAKLKKDYQEFIQLEKKTNGLKSEINAYIYFLVIKKGYMRAEIAQLLGLSRERVGQIVQNYKGGVIS